MADRWYCNLQGREIGPLQLAALVEMSRRGSLHRDDRVRRGDRGAWAIASTVAGLFPEGEEGGLEVVSTLDELAIDIAGSTDESIPEGSPSTTGSGKLEGSGTVSTDPGVINDLSELDFEFANSSPQSVPVAGQPESGRPHSEKPHSEKPHSDEVAPVDEWYCEVFGQTMGPMPFGDLKHMVDNDELSPKDRVRMGESGAWMAAVSVSGLIPEDDFELSPAVVVSPLDVSSLDAMPETQQPASAAPRAIDPPDHQTTPADRPDDTSEPKPAQNAQAESSPQSLNSSDEESTSANESSSTTDLNEWLNEETAATAVPQGRPDDDTTQAAPKEETSAERADADRHVVDVLRKPVSRRPKVSRPRRSLGDLFAPVIDRGKALAMIGGGILVVGLLILFFMTKGQSLFSHDKEYYEAYLSLYQEFRLLRDQDASDVQWSAFIEKANQENKTRLKWLEAAASPKYPARQFLLFVARDNWPAMISTARSKPSMDEWRLVTNLQSAHSKIEGSTAPPEPPKRDSAKQAR